MQPGDFARAVNNGAGERAKISAGQAAQVMHALKTDANFAAKHHAWLVAHHPDLEPTPAPAPAPAPASAPAPADTTPAAAAPDASTPATATPASSEAP